MPSMSCVIEVDETPLSAHGWVTTLGERSACVELNARDGSVHGPMLGRLGELSLCGSPEAMRRLAEALLFAADEAERLPVPTFAEAVSEALVAAG